MIIVNFKKYVSGEAAVNLAKICKKVSDETNVKIIVAVQPEDIYPEIECWSQKPEDPTLPFSGTLINHSDYPVDLESWILDLKIKKCICVNSFEEAVVASKFNPDYIAYEPHELIGSRDKSVASEKPSYILDLTSKINVPILIGAGIHSPEDIKVGLQLGAKGFLLATDVVKAVDPEKQLRELAVSYIKNSKS